MGTAVSANFPKLTLIHNQDGTTSFIGAQSDQAALHSVLARGRDLGLVLMAVIQRTKDFLLP